MLSGLFHLLALKTLLINYFQLVNKLFNKGCIAALQKSHEKVTIEANEQNRFPFIFFNEDEIKMNKGVTVNKKYCTEHKFYEHLKRVWFIFGLFLNIKKTILFLENQFFGIKFY